MTKYGEARVWFDAHYLDPSDGPCSVWPFCTDRDGYGLMWVAGAMVRVHAYALALRAGPAPEGMVARHGPCHNPACLTHVEWSTQAENVADKYRDGTALVGERNHQAILTEGDVRRIRQLRADGVPLLVVAAEFGTTKTNVSMIATRQTWAWLE